MNKKFFTLIASVFMLAASLGTGNAQTVVPIDMGTAPATLTNGGKYQMVAILKGEFDGSLTAWQTWFGGNNLTSNTQTDLKLASNQSSLYNMWVDEDGILRHRKGGNGIIGKYYESIFCVTRSIPAVAGQNATLNIQSWAHKSLILADPASALYKPLSWGPSGQPGKAENFNVKLGSVGDWGYSSVYDRRIEHFMPLYTYMPGSNDTVMVLALKKDREDLAERIVTVKYAASDVNRGVNLGDSVLLFEFINPAPRVLDAADFNTIMGSQAAEAHKLKFNPDVLGTDIENPWTNFALKAFNVVAGNAAVDAGGFAKHNASNTGSLVDLPNGATGNWLYFQKKDDGKFLYVDTAYYRDLNEAKLRFNWGDTLSAYWARTLRGGSDISGTSALGTGANVNSAYIAYNRKDGKIDTTGWANASAARRIEIKDSVNREFMNHYRFRAIYYWENDSLGIDVATANLKPASNYYLGNPISYWREFPSAAWEQPYYDNFKGFGTNGITSRATVDVNAEYARDKSVDFSSYHIAPGPITNGDKLHIKLFGLEDSRVLTIGERDTKTTIKFGIENCGKIENNFTSVKTKGVYLIKNTSGKYLQVPIYRYLNRDGSGNLTNPENEKAIWASIKDEVVDPRRQPSYHWIVLKETATDATKASLTLINREFPDIRYTGVRLYTDRKGVIRELVNSDGKIGTGDSLALADGSFTQLTGSYINEEHLGYYWISESDAKTSKFDLNYYSDVLAWAEQPQDFFLGLSDVKDDTTTMIKKGRNTQYAFIPKTVASNGRGINYGWTVPMKNNAVDTDHPNYIPGLTQLKRVYYMLEGPNKTYFTANREHRYTLSNKLRENDPVANIRDTAFFFLKANNYAVLNPDAKEKVDFYAMLDVNSISTLGWNTVSSYNTYNFHDKIGIADDTGWAYEQWYDETRTSAFAVTQYMDPLYRRFDNLKYTFGAGRDSTQEKYQGDSSRWAPLYLKFNDMIQDWMHLYENSDNTNKYRKGLKNISILGLQDPKRFPEGDAAANKPYYQFYVDTAFITRKPDGSTTNDYKLYTPMPQYMLVLNPSALAKSRIWYQDGSTTWVEGEGKPNEWPDGAYGEPKPVDVLAMTVGRYLFNAQDSVNVGNKEYLGNIDNNIENDILLSFVKGVHFQDTFYVVEGTDLEKYVTSDDKAFENAKKLQVAQAMSQVLYKLSWYHKHPLNKNVHYVERFTASGSSDAETLKMRADSIKKYKANIGTEVPSWVENGKSMVFQFRLRNVGQASGNPDRDFYIETQRVDGAEIGPDVAKFINIHNGVPVISKNVSFPKDAQENEAALGLNVTKADEDAYGKPGYTSAEAAYVNDATIISNTGSVSVLNAAGKTVTVTNVLGQTIAKTVAASDNATIALPKGIVVVSVDGKSAKAVVK